MTQEDKELLFKDLCNRLLYDVYAETINELGDTHINRISPENINLVFSGWFKECKLYLRPMSSMTEEEKKELERLIDEKLNRNTDQEDDEWAPWVLHDTTGIRNYIGGERFYFDDMSFVYDWLNTHHFDYRGLIDRGLALTAPGGMYI